METDEGAQLRAVLQDAQPSWSEKSVSTAESKLLQIGISSAEELADALRGNLNERLRTEGLKTFSADTVRGLRTALGVKPRAGGGKKAAVKQPRIAEAGEDLYQEFFALVDAPSDTTVAPARSPPPPQPRVHQDVGGDSREDELPDDLDPDLIRSIQSFQDSSLAELRAECRRRGLPGGDRPKDHLLAVLQEDLTWQGMGNSKLRKLCEERGLQLPERGQKNERSVLLSALADDRWVQIGIPIRRLSNRQNAQDLLSEIQRIDRLQIGQLMPECRSLKLPAKPTMGKKRLAEMLQQTKLWRHLTLQELMVECAQCGGMTPSPTTSREQLLQELHRSTSIEEWEALGVPARRFSDLKVAEDLADEFSRIKEMADSRLKALCAELGIPLDSYVQRQELLRRLRNYKIWQRMPTTELEKECILTGLPSAVRGPSSRAREQLVDRLLNHACMTTWKVLGIPAEHLSLKAASHVADVFDYLDSASEGDLREKYQDTFLDEQMDRNEIVERLKLVVLWQELPCSALHDECLHKGIKLDDVGKVGVDEDDDSEEQRDLLMGKLLLHERTRLWKNQGFPTERLHNAEAAEQLITKRRDLEAMSTEQIAREYRALGLPEEEDMGRSEMKKVLSTRALWWALSWPELIKECQDRDIEVEHLLDPGGDEDELWSKHVNTLMKKLLEFESLHMWEMKGYPIRRLRNFDAAVLLVERYEQIAHSTIQELCKECEAAKLPASRDTDREVLARRMRIRAFWRGLSVLELIHECEKRSLPVGDVIDADTSGAPRSELWQRQTLVRKLSDFECLAAWEEEGIPAQRIGNVEAVYSLAARYGSLRTMSTGELRAAYVEKGLPEEELVERHAMLKNLKQVLEWEAMPAEELRRECQERDMPAAVWANAEHQALLDRLLMDLYESVYASKGVPVKSLTSLKAAAVLARRFEQLKSMAASQLQEECAKLGMLPGVQPPSILRERLRKASLWEQLSWEHLQKEVARAGLAAEAATLPSQLRDLLMLSQCSEDFRGLGVPVHRLRSMQAAVALEKKMRDVKEFSTDELRQECRDKRVPTKARASRAELLALVSDLNLWEELPCEELRSECDRVGIAHWQLIPGSIPHEDQRQYLRDVLICRASQPALAERGIPEQEVVSQGTCFTVVQAWDRIGALDAAQLRREYEGYGLPSASLSVGEMVARLRQMCLWMEAPLQTIQKECRKAGINSIARENEKADLVKKLVRAIWSGPTPEQRQQQRQREQEQQRQREQQEQRRQDRDRQQKQQQQKSRGAAAPSKSSGEQRLQMATHLRTLGLSMPLDVEEVKKSYRKLVLKHHPDKNPDADKEKAAETFRAIHEAYKFIMEHAESQSSRRAPSPRPSEDTGDSVDAVSANSFALVGSWSDWRSLVELVADSSGNYSADVPIALGEEVEFQVLCDGNWSRRLYPSKKGDLVLGPAGDGAHGMNWRLPPQRSCTTLRVKLRPRTRRLEYFATR